MRVALGCDHRGLDLKRALMQVMAQKGHDREDLGCYDTTPVDYPDIARRVAEAVRGGGFDRGILICGTGIGMSMAANRVKGIRAALCHDPFGARRARQHNDANVLCLGAEVVDPALAEEIVNVFLDTAFEGGRHSQRLKKMEAIEC